MRNTGEGGRGGGGKGEGGSLCTKKGKGGKEKKRKKKKKKKKERCDEVHKCLWGSVVVVLSVQIRNGMDKKNVQQRRRCK